MVNILVVTHGEFGAYLTEAAEGIVGVQGEGVKNISVLSRMSFKDVEAKTKKAVKECHGPGGLVCLVDIPGGSPMNALLLAVKDMDNTAVICGVNMNMVITAFSNRGKMPLGELVKKIINAGKKAVRDINGAIA